MVFGNTLVFLLAMVGGHTAQTEVVPRGQLPTAEQLGSVNLEVAQEKARRFLKMAHRVENVAANDFRFELSDDPFQVTRNLDKIRFVY